MVERVRLEVSEVGQQDNAFDIEHACKKKCPGAAKDFIKYTWELEEEVDKLVAEVKRLKTGLDFINKEMLKNIACGGQR